MEETEQSQNLLGFLNSGIYRFPDSDTVFIDPVRVLNQSYIRFTVSSSAYYSRFFHPQTLTNPTSPNPKKRKRNDNKKKKNQPLVLNGREQAAEKRHQEARPLLLKAHQFLLRASELLSVLPTLRDENITLTEEIKTISLSAQMSLIELGQLWQAPLYEMTFNFHQYENPTGDGGLQSVQEIGQRTHSIFNNLVVNDSQGDVEAEFLTSCYILPKESCFYMSDLQQIHNLIPADPDCGFHLIVVDPPWENGSAHQKLRYPTLPNRHFLSLPIKALAHRDGALVALWVTNREKLRDFVEKELFPAWGVKQAATFFWLKVKADGSLISDLDLFHHRPYECLLLGFCDKEVDYSGSNARIRHMKDKQVFISIPGDYSRKPPVEGLLLEHAPGLKPARCIELFARELKSGCLSWGNEPLLYQESIYFQKREFN